jgi:uncharacterized protein YdeI (YjbR/CyaY-like superfamily)
MKQLRVRTREEWRKWLSENHLKEQAGIWLVFEHKTTGKRSLEYEEAIEAALCYGWIDSIVKNIDQASYCRKFTPRRLASRWSETNKRRVAKLISEGVMTKFGLAKIEAAKKSGRWDEPSKTAINPEMPPELSAALARNPAANAFFQKLAPTYRKHFVGWISTAKADRTKTRRLNEALELLSKNKKLGLK